MGLSVLERLYELAFLQNIEVVKYDLPERVCGLYFEKGALRTITINNAIRTSGQEAAVMAEEIGHSVVGGGDLVFPGGADPVFRKRAEIRAQYYAYVLVLPVKKLKRALSRGETPYEIAEEFGLSEDFVRCAIKAYSAKGFFPSAHRGDLPD